MKVSFCSSCKASVMMTLNVFFLLSLPEFWLSLNYQRSTQLVSFLFQGVFVALVHASSPAALAGLRFGDQILQVNGENAAGWDTDKAMKVLKKAAPEKITLAIRDR